MDVIIHSFENYCKTPIVICLGFFDCLHIGHLSVIGKAEKVAQECKAETALFTFSSNPANVFGKGDKEIFTLSERLSRAGQLGIRHAVVARADKEFMQMSPEDFLAGLTDRFNIKAVVAGSDYTFGRGGKGNTDMLRAYCSGKGIAAHIVDLMDVDGRKIASRDIKELLKSGDIKAVNRLLPMPYIITGKVVHGRQDGRKIGFPTANMNPDREKLLPLRAVYYTNVNVDGKVYPAISNIGTHPTFDDYNDNIETHIIGLDADLYDKVLTVEFLDKIRDISKFSTKEEFVAQLNKDVKFALNRYADDKIRT